MELDKADAFRYYCADYNQLSIGPDMNLVRAVVCETNCVMNIISINRHRGECSLSSSIYSMGVIVRGGYFISRTSIMIFLSRL